MKNNLLKITVLLFFGVLLFSVLLSVFLVRYEKASRCENIIALAKNEEKISYLYSWINAYLQDEKKLSELGYSGNIYADDSPLFFDSLNIDWDFIGISHKLAFISVNRKNDDRNDYLNFENIKSFSVGEGRNSLILRLNKSDDLGFPDNKIFNEKLILINKNVSVYCD